MIKLFTIVKDECDIIREWIIYHGYLFGYENLFIIDNNSTDGTFEIMQEFLKNGINISREYDYSKKGTYMQTLINNNCKIGDIAYPLDIDEFIVYHNRGSKEILCDKEKINSYILNLPNIPNKVYKANYLASQITENGGYKNAAHDNKWAIYCDYGSVAKAFYKVGTYSGSIDHGNHFGGKKYFLTNICLVHFHCRNVEQMKKKVLNNVIGLGYPNNLEKLKNLIEENPGTAGFHHVKNLISIMEGTFKLPVISYNDTLINIENLNNFIKTHS